MRQPAGYAAMVPDPLPPALRPTRALDQLLGECARAIAAFSVDDTLRNRLRVAETDEDRAVRHAAGLLAQGALAAGWSVELLCAAQATVVLGGRGGERFPGQVRRAQSWIGSSLESASYVPPPGDLLCGQLDDLVAFLATPEGFAPPVTAALACAQVVLIHAFNDGNGRLGRAVALAVLSLHGLPLEFPLNRALRLDRGAYLRAVQAVAQHGAWEYWIAFFLQTTKGATPHD